MEASKYKFLRCGSHVLWERNLAHSANMAENPLKMEAKEGEPNSDFQSFSFLRASWRQEGPRGGQEGTGEFQE